MVALRSQGNWRWEGPLGTPLGLVRWKRASSPVEAGTALWSRREYGTFSNTESKGRVMGKGAGEGKGGEGLADPPKESSFSPNRIKNPV